jgi:hypothetical protein
MTNVTQDETIAVTFAAEEPGATSLSRPSVSPSSPKHGKTATFTGRITPAAAVAAGTTRLSFYHSARKTVRKKVGGKWKSVKVTYWRGTTSKNMSASADGSLRLRYKVPYAGKWKIVSSYSGAEGYAPSSSAVKYFTAK